MYTEMAAKFTHHNSSITLSDDFLLATSSNGLLLFLHRLCAAPQKSGIQKLLGSDVNEDENLVPIVCSHGRAVLAHDLVEHECM